MANSRKRLGDKGEALAASYLKKKGYNVVSKQDRTPFGEIDLVCKYQGEIIFVEVKTRQTATFGFPEEAVTKDKMNHMIRSAEFLRNKNHWLEQPWRMDVIAIEYDQDPVKITHIEGIDAPEQ